MTSRTGSFGLSLAVVTCFASLAGCADLVRPSKDEPSFGEAKFEGTGNAPPPRPAASAPVAAAPGGPLPDGTIQASHILVSFKGSRGQNQTRTKDEAKARINEILGKLKGGDTFEKLAGEYGEDGTKTRGGDLGPFTKDKMVPEFANAAFALKPGETSGLVESPFGFHLIKRTR